MKNQDMDHLEELSEYITGLEEAESLAEEAQPQMVAEIRSLISSALNELRQFAKKILGRRISLGSASPKVPMELLERLFATLRDKAESRWNKSIHLSGKEARRIGLEAEHLAKLAHTAAVSVKIAAESRGIWNDRYIREHGLGPWI